MSVQTLDDLYELAGQLRVDSIRASTAAGSGHPTSSMSAADLMAVLLARHLRYDWDRPRRAGQRPPDLLQGTRLAAALLDVQGGGRGLRRGADERVPAIRVAGCRATPPRCCRGSTSPPARSARGCPTASASRWPAGTSTSCRTASGCCAGTARWRKARSGRPWTRRRYYRLANLTAIVDVNRLGQRGPTELGWDLDAYARRVEAFGCPRAPHRRPRPRRNRRGACPGRRDGATGPR